MFEQNNEQNLAEIIGIMLGDGCLHFDVNGKYQTAIAFSLQEEAYLQHVKNLFSEFFYPYRFCTTKLKHEFLLRNTSVKIGEYFLTKAISSGNKVKNNQKIPDWLLNRADLLPNLLRGIFDTDGCIYRKYDKYAQMEFKSACLPFIISISNSLEKLDIKHSRIQKYLNKAKGKYAWKLYICRQVEIDKFFKIVKPSNEKHIRRYCEIRAGE